MDRNKCNNQNCDAPDEIGCMIPGCDIQDCPDWQAANNISISDEESVTDTTEVEDLGKVKSDFVRVNWTGNSMGLNNLFLIKKRSVPIVIGVVGLFNSGKTTFLSMLYLLLASGKKIGNFNFSGSYSLIGWENISWSMRWNEQGQFSFPAHTSTDIGRNQGYLHLALKKDNIVRDIIFTDVPGEWFTKWMENTENKAAEGANRIIKESDGFIFFVDCDGLNKSNTNRTLIKRNTENLAARLNNHLSERPIALLWSKADTKKNIRENVLLKLDRKLKTFFPLSKGFDVSFKEGGNREYHNNILKTIDWIVEQLETPPKPKIEIEDIEEQNYFFKYRGLEYE